MESGTFCTFPSGKGPFGEKVTNVRSTIAERRETEWRRSTAEPARSVGPISTSCLGQRPRPSLADRENIGQVKKPNEGIVAARELDV
jgi:hypothetical protein